MLVVRLGFYAGEAIVLASIVLCALLVGRRSGIRLWPSRSWPNTRAFGAIALGLFLFDTVSSEILGPRAIVQYYAVTLLVVVAAASLALSHFKTRIRRRRSDIE